MIIRFREETLGIKHGNNLILQLMTELSFKQTFEVISKFFAGPFNTAELDEMEPSVFFQAIPTHFYISFLLALCSPGFNSFVSLVTVRFILQHLHFPQKLAECLNTWDSYVVSCFTLDYLIIAFFKCTYSEVVYLCHFLCNNEEKLVEFYCL